MRDFFLQNVTLNQLLRWTRNIVLITGAIVLLLSLLLWRMWQVRGTIAEIGWETAPVAAEPADSVTATWLGTSTLLFDDGETQILIDAAFTRISPLDAILFRPVKSDFATINYALSTFRMDRLAAIIPVHSHHDHAMDTGHVANRSSAVVLGSESTANIVRGADIPVDQYQILADGETRQFGEFTIKLIASVHAPIGLGGEEIFPGIIDAPLRQPARISAYRTGVAWSIMLTHPRGTTLVQGSGGFIEGKLQGETADVVMLGIAGLADLGEGYTRKFWQETVVATSAPRVISIHHDDFTATFGEVRLFPDMLDNIVKTAGWIDELVAASDGTVTITFPPFGQPILLY
jgi:L-ascorbate metabolism protein UlaG (beta-lactamase superfamily)